MQYLPSGLRIRYLFDPACVEFAAVNQVTILMILPGMNWNLVVKKTNRAIWRQQLINSGNKMSTYEPMALTSWGQRLARRNSLNQFINSEDPWRVSQLICCPDLRCLVIETISLQTYYIYQLAHVACRPIKLAYHKMSDWIIDNLVSQEFL